MKQYTSQGGISRGGGLRRLGFKSVHDDYNVGVMIKGRDAAGDYASGFILEQSWRCVTSFIWIWNFQRNSNY